MEKHKTTMHLAYANEELRTFMQGFKDTTVLNLHQLENLCWLNERTRFLLPSCSTYNKPSKRCNIYRYEYNDMIELIDNGNRNQNQNKLILKN